MLTFRPKSRRLGRSASGVSRPAAAGGHSIAPSPSPAHAWASAQDGFQLVEVMVSALLLGLISVATFTGLQAVNTSNANLRFHNEAQLLAAQSQETLRTDPISTLEKLVNAAKVYSPKVDGTTYTITQSVSELNGSGAGTSCTATEQAAHTAPNFRVSTSVTWHALEGSHPVKESSIVTPPTGSSLEVDVDNAPTPTAGVSGVTAVVTYSALETGSAVKLEGTTGSAGCILFTGIRATSAKVAIAEKANFVTPSGTLAIPTAEVSIAPNLTSHYAVTYNEGGAIAAKFTYQGKAATGDTFVMSNTLMTLPPELEVGSTAFAEPYGSGGEEAYTAKTGLYQSQALTAKGAKYAHGDLFAFPSSKWSVFAGDCAANNPLTVTAKAVLPGEGVVSPGATTAVEAPMSYVKLEVRKGTEKSSPAKATETYKVKITNLSCSAAVPAPASPDNAAAVSYTHLQSTTSAGVLEAPYQPFGKFELCLQAVAVPPGTTAREDKISYLNSTVTGSAFKIYPEEPTAAEKKASREKEELPAKEARVKEEAAQATQKSQEEAKWSAREAEETTLKNAQTSEEAANTTKEAVEATERSSWVYYETHFPKISHSERVTKENAQTTARNARHIAEATKAATRKSEESTLHTRRTTEEGTRAARAAAETATATTKAKEEAIQASKLAEEAKETAEKETRIKEGTAATVEAGTC